MKTANKIYVTTTHRLATDSDENGRDMFALVDLDGTTMISIDKSWPQGTYDANAVPGHNTGWLGREDLLKLRRLITRALDFTR